MKMDSNLIALFIIVDSDEKRIEISSDSTVLELKKQILKELKLTGIIDNYLFSSFNHPNNFRDNTVSIKDLEIINGSMIFVIKLLKGGGSDLCLSYLNVSQGKLAKFNVGHLGNKQLVITKGLNLEGKCSNTKCEFYDKPVICPIGMGTYDLVDHEKNRARSICPICKQFTLFDNCGFYQCQYTFKGTICDLKQKKFEEVNIQRRTNESQYECFDEPSVAEKAKWADLIVEVTSLDDLNSLE